KYLFNMITNITNRVSLITMLVFFWTPSCCAAQSIRGQTEKTAEHQKERKLALKKKFSKYKKTIVATLILGSIFALTVIGSHFKKKERQEQAALERQEAERKQREQEEIARQEQAVLERKEAERRQREQEEIARQKQAALERQEAERKQREQEEIARQKQAALERQEAERKQKEQEEIARQKQAALEKQEAERKQREQEQQEKEQERLKQLRNTYLSDEELKKQAQLYIDEYGNLKEEEKSNLKQPEFGSNSSSIWIGAKIVLKNHAVEIRYQGIKDAQAIVRKHQLKRLTVPNAIVYKGWLVAERLDLEKKENNTSNLIDSGFDWMIYYKKHQKDKVLAEIIREFAIYIMYLSMQKSLDEFIVKNPRLYGYASKRDEVYGIKAYIGGGYEALADHPYFSQSGLKGLDHFQKISRGYIKPLGINYANASLVKGGRIGVVDFDKSSVIDFDRSSERGDQISPEAIKYLNFHKIEVLITWAPFHFDYIRQTIKELTNNQKDISDFGGVEEYKKLMQGYHNYVLRWHLDYIENHPLPIHNGKKTFTEAFQIGLKRIFNQRLEEFKPSKKSFGEKRVKEFTTKLSEKDASDHFLEILNKAFEENLQKLSKGNTSYSFFKMLSKAKAFVKNLQKKGDLQKFQERTFLIKFTSFEYFVENTADYENRDLIEEFFEPILSELRKEGLIYEFNSSVLWGMAIRV
ncbi:MAG: hypothetical protein AAF335_03660, partial [Bacteroidota bacterium]